jgi:hypothetical protein
MGRERRWIRSLRKRVLISLMLPCDIRSLVSNQCEEEETRRSEI